MSECVFVEQDSWCLTHHGRSQYCLRARIAELEAEVKGLREEVSAVKPSPCPTCEGSGLVDDRSSLVWDSLYMKTDCPTCNGGAK